MDSLEPMAPASDVTIRRLNGIEEIDRFLELSYVLDHELSDDLAAGRRRLEWMWLALLGDRVAGRLAWWSRPGEPVPLMLDFFDVDDFGPAGDTAQIEIGARLLRTAMAADLPAGAAHPEYLRFVPTDWREQPGSRRVVETRMAALEKTGARLLVERLRLEWRSGTPIPGDSERLRFRPAGDRDELIGMMAAVLEGTLDVHSHEDLMHMSPVQAATRQYDGEFAGYPSPQDWWRIATLPDGQPVGFVIPAENAYNPIIAYIGVLPAHRGRGYIDDILAEGTRVLAGQGVSRIRASTDLGNVPMAKAFERVGYVTFERTINMAWAPAGS